MSNNKLSLKEQDAKDFESVLSDENKRRIEKILDSIPAAGSSDFCVQKVVEALELMLGKRATRFLRNLIDASDASFIKDIKTISSETRRYSGFLYATYGSRLFGVLSRRIFIQPDAYRAVGLLSTRYDVDLEIPFMRMSILKENGERTIVEESANALVFMASSIIGTVVESSSDIIEFNKDLGIEKSTLDSLKKVVNELDRIVATQETVTTKD